MRKQERCDRWHWDLCLFESSPPKSSTFHNTVFCVVSSISGYHLQYISSHFASIVYLEHQLIKCIDCFQVSRMASKEQDPTVNGHPGGETGEPTGIRAGSEGKQTLAQAQGGRSKNDQNAQNRPKSEPNCCLLENGKRCTKPASNASYR